MDPSNQVLPPDTKADCGQPQGHGANKDHFVQYYYATLLQWYNKRVKVNIVLIYVDFNVTVNCHV